MALVAGRHAGGRDVPVHLQPLQCAGHHRPPGRRRHERLGRVPGGIYVFGCPIDGSIGYHYIKAPAAKLPEGSKERRLREAESRATEAVRATGINWGAAALALVVVVALVLIGWAIVSASAIAAAVAALVALLVA